MISSTQATPPQTTEASAPGRDARALRWQWAAVAGCVLVLLYCAVYPLYRACFPVEISYNEGWNIFNALRVRQHLPLYGEAMGWTRCNYPGLSFWNIAQLSRLTGEVFYTGRALSVLGWLAGAACCGAAVWSVTRDRLSAVLTAMFCLTLFCCCGFWYVGADDPQLLAQAFTLAAFALYAGRRQGRSLLAVALLFALGASIKHNQIDFIFAVIVDLWFVSRWRAVKFAVLMAALGALVVAANIYFGGPYFVQQLLTPRSYSGVRILAGLRDYYGPLLIPIVTAFAMAWRVRHDARLRLFALLLAISFLLGVYFSGGTGVSINAHFSSSLAMTLLLGLALAEARRARLPRWMQAPCWPALLPLVYFAWMLIPLACNEIFSLPENLREVRAEAAQTRAQVEMLRAVSGSVLCESLLRCYLADKPYLYDPFNATSLIEAHRLDAGVMAARVRRQEFGAVQLSYWPDKQGRPRARPERFADEILQAIGDSYRVARSEKGCTIYVPRRAEELTNEAAVQPIAR